MTLNALYAVLSLLWYLWIIECSSILLSNAYSATWSAGVWHKTHRSIASATKVEFDKMDTILRRNLLTSRGSKVWPCISEFIDKPLPLNLNNKRGLLLWIIFLHRQYRRKDGGWLLLCTRFQKSLSFCKTENRDNHFQKVKSSLYKNVVEFLGKKSACIILFVGSYRVSVARYLKVKRSVLLGTIRL